MSSLFDNIIEKEDDNKPTCKGIIYKCKINNFINRKGHYIEKISMIPMKTLSCKGCVTCGWIEETMDDVIACDGNIQFVDKPEHNELYELKVTDTFTDWETGMVDEFYIGFVKIKT
jgi:hypothetical protein